MNGGDLVETKEKFSTMLEEKFKLKVLDSVNLKDSEDYSFKIQLTPYQVKRFTSFFSTGDIFQSVEYSVTGDILNIQKGNTWDILEMFDLAIG